MLALGRTDCGQVQSLAKQLADLMAGCRQAPPGVPVLPTLSACKQSDVMFLNYGDVSYSHIAADCDITLYYLVRTAHAAKEGII